MLVKKQLAIVGYGNQAQAWAHNLKDSGWDVPILLRDNSDSRVRAERDGFVVQPLSAISAYENIALLLPDQAMPRFYEACKTYFQPDQKLIFAHGFSLHFKTAPWPETCGHILLAPKAIAIEVRAAYQEKRIFPGVYSLANARAGEHRRWVEALADDLAMGPLVEASVADEVKADLLSEQVLLCGGIPKLIALSFDALVARGVHPEVAYLECVHEVGIFAELFRSRGFDKSLAPISPTARFGAYTAWQKLNDQPMGAAIDALMGEIENGNFLQALVSAEKNENRDDVAWSQHFKDTLLEKTAQQMQKKMREAQIYRKGKP